jgi:hypothetical protein
VLLDRRPSRRITRPPDKKTPFVNGSSRLATARLADNHRLLTVAAVTTQESGWARHLFGRFQASADDEPSERALSQL